MTGDWLVTGLEPIFNVVDIARSAVWYERAGFDVSFHDDSYAFAHRDRGLTIHLALATEGDPTGRGALYLHCQEADRVAEEWSQAGIAVHGPEDEECGKREGFVQDPDGCLIRFGSPIR